MRPIDEIIRFSPAKMRAHHFCRLLTETRPPHPGQLAGVIWVYQCLVLTGTAVPSDSRGFQRMITWDLSWNATAACRD